MEKKENEREKDRERDLKNEIGSNKEGVMQRTKLEIQAEEERT